MGKRTGKCLYANHSISRKEIARAIRRKYSGTGRYRGITEHKMNLVISRIMELKVEAMYRTGYVDIGYGFGTVELKQITIIRDDFKKIRINWNRTLDLWLDNPEARKQKKLVRFVDSREDCYSFEWKRAGIENISYFSFTPFRPLKHKLAFLLANNKPIMTLQ